ncbi:hypothetical protein F2P81_009793 [Scophthalmus maximus]|uniref:Uncharacterized protein n=1 Tax=Scophthalmus maximus TaxID=52904 RepID=A0A6A4SW65_SCOMX|nr:hypothetical protein F2P81_009793 [Scophthalmus maximus]
MFDSRRSDTSPPAAHTGDLRGAEGSPETHDEPSAASALTSRPRRREPESSRGRELRRRRGDGRTDTDDALRLRR